MIGGAGAVTRGFPAVQSPPLLGAACPSGGRSLTGVSLTAAAAVLVTIRPRCLVLLLAVRWRPPVLLRLAAVGSVLSPVFSALRRAGRIPATGAPCHAVCPLPPSAGAPRLRPVPLRVVSPPPGIHGGGVCRCRYPNRPGRALGCSERLGARGRTSERRVGGRCHRLCTNRRGGTCLATGQPPTRSAATHRTSGDRPPRPPRPAPPRPASAPAPAPSQSRPGRVAWGKPWQAPREG